MGDPPPPPHWENMKCAILFMRTAEMACAPHPFISLIVFCFDWTSTSHVQHYSRPESVARASARSFLRGDQSQPTKSLRSCLVSSWHRLSLLPFFVWLSPADMMMRICSWHPFKLRARRVLFGFSITPLPKKQDFYDYYHHHFLFIYTCTYK